MRETILSDSGKVARPVVVIAVFLIAFSVSDYGFVENADALIGWIVVAVVAGAVLGAIIAGNYWANLPSLYVGGITDAIDAYTDVENQLEKWEIQYAQADIVQQNYQNMFADTAIPHMRECVAESYYVLEYDTWPEALSRMNCFDSFNTTMESIGISVMSSYASIDMDVISETTTTELLYYSDVYQPAGAYNPAAAPQRWVDVDYISYGIDYAGNYDSNGNYIDGEYLLNYLYVPPLQSLKVDGELISGGSFGLLANYTNFVSGALIPLTYTLTDFSSNNIYVNGMLKDTFGPNEYGDIVYYNSNNTDYNDYDLYCYRDYPSTTCSLYGVGSGPAWEHFDFVNDKKLSEVVLRHKWNSTLDYSVIDFELYVDLNYDGVPELIYDVPMSAAMEDEMLSIRFNATTNPSLFGSGYITDEMAIGIGLSGPGTSGIINSLVGLTFYEDVGEDKLFFRREEGNEIGIYYPSLDQVIYPPLKYNVNMPSKNLQTLNFWQTEMDKMYVAVYESAFVKWTEQKILGRDSIEDVPEDEVILYPDAFGLGNINALQGINADEAFFIYWSVVSQMAMGFCSDASSCLYNVSDAWESPYFDASDISIGNFSQYNIHANFTTVKNVEIPNSTYWVTPLNMKYTFINNTCGRFPANSIFQAFDIENQRFYNIFSNSTSSAYYCIWGIVEENNYVDNATYDTTNMENFVNVNYGISLEIPDKGLIVYDLSAQLLTYAGIAIGVGVALIIVAAAYPRLSWLKYIGYISVLIAVAIAAYWAISVYVYPWLLNVWEALTGWWPL